jgi:hypothetical protein
MNTEQPTVAFQAISSFINDLSDVFGEDQRSLKLYAHLISKTTAEHEIAISKHVQVFTEFCVLNRASIESKNINLKSKLIVYSDKVMIDMSAIFKIADSSTTKVIWRHLLIISALLDVAGKALTILKETPGKESDFMSDIIEKIELNINPEQDAASSIMSLMNSGVFTDLMQGLGSGMSDGTLDINSLLGGVQRIISKTGGSTEGGEAPDISKMLGPLMGMLSSPGEEGEAPDISKMLGPLMGMLSSPQGGEAPDLSGLLASLMPPSPK